MSAPYYTVRAYASWADVDRGRIAHGSRHDGPGARERAMALRDALPYPIVDVIRHDPALDGRGGGRVIADRVDTPHPAYPMGRPVAPCRCYPADDSDR